MFLPNPDPQRPPELDHGQSAAIFIDVEREIKP
jgi:hypothetical protein